MKDISNNVLHSDRRRKGAVTTLVSNDPHTNGHGSVHVGIQKPHGNPRQREGYEEPGENAESNG